MHDSCIRQGGGAVGRTTNPGSARLVLADGVALLHPEDAVFAAMLEGWSNQQAGGRGLRNRTINQRASDIRRFTEFAGAYPWSWSAAHMDEWSISMISEEKLSGSTVRSRQGAVRLFCDYITSPFYDWVEQCETRFGAHPTQICHEWNTRVHLVVLC